MIQRVSQNGLAGVKFPASRLRWARAGASAPTAREALSRLRVDALVCGPMWRDDEVEASSPLAALLGTALLPLAAIAGAVRGMQFLHRQVNDLVPAASNRRTAGSTVVVLGGEATLRAGANDPGQGVAVQGYPLLVKDGRVAGLREDEQNTGRAALCIFDSVTVGFLIGQGPIVPFAQALSRVCRDAVYLDGGSSLVLQVPSWREVSVGSDRHVGGSWLYCASVQEERASLGASLTIGALGVLALYLLTRRRGGI